MPKLVFKVYKNSEIQGPVIRVSQNTIDLVNQIIRDTGLPASKIIEKCVAFAAENYEVEEV